MLNNTHSNVLWVAILLLATVAAVDISCPQGSQTPAVVRSSYYNLWIVKFRRFRLQCRDFFSEEGAFSCSWSDVERETADSYEYDCPRNGVITGIRASMTSNTRYQYQFRCCDVAGLQLSNCTTTEYLNGYREDFSYSLPANHVIRGYSSIYSRYWSDRKLKLDICEISGTGVIRNK